MKGYRTIIINALTVLAAVGASVNHEAFPAEWGPYIVAAVGLVNIALRFVTNTPVGVK